MLTLAQAQTVWPGVGRCGPCLLFSAPWDCWGLWQDHTWESLSWLLIVLLWQTQTQSIGAKQCRPCSCADRPLRKRRRPCLDSTWDTCFLIAWPTPGPSAWRAPPLCFEQSLELFFQKLLQKWANISLYRVFFEVFTLCLNVFYLGDPVRGISASGGSGVFASNRRWELQRGKGWEGSSFRWWWLDFPLRRGFKHFI